MLIDFLNLNRGGEMMLSQRKVGMRGHANGVQLLMDGDAHQGGRIPHRQSDRLTRRPSVPCAIAPAH
jgi:hypothetical protein